MDPSLHFSLLPSTQSSSFALLLRSSNKNKKFLSRRKKSCLNWKMLPILPRMKNCQVPPKKLPKSNNLPKWKLAKIDRLYDFFSTTQSNFLKKHSLQHPTFFCSFLLISHLGASRISLARWVTLRKRSNKEVRMQREQEKRGSNASCLSHRQTQGNIFIERHGVPITLLFFGKKFGKLVSLLLSLSASTYGGANEEEGRKRLARRCHALLFFAFSSFLPRFLWQITNSRVKNAKKEIFFFFLNPILSFFLSFKNFFLAM